MSDVMPKMEELIKQWQAAGRLEASLRADLLKAERRLQTTEENLAMFLLPEDAKQDEKYCVWYGDSLISATDAEAGYEVSIRKRGKSLSV